ncbi:MAG: AarF/ABC1/UbiB kinase family protein [Polyangiaceae bacterium]|nr:AarF/ABC1/UbiB kinase family protein [Polyangiaceae bacterium]
MQPWILASGAALLVVLALAASRTARRFLWTNLILVRAYALSFGARLVGRKGTHPARLREAFETLGPTYVKLAQLVASSEGLFPEAYCIEFRKCLDRVPPFPIEDVRRILREELGREPEELFEELDVQPLASASIAQVHGARLRDGTDVVLKVQRPHIEELVASDLRVLRLLARILVRMPLGEMANPVGVVDDFASTLRQELDFRLEAANLDEFNEIMARYGFSDVAAPVPFHEYSGVRVLVMERFRGYRIDDKEGLAIFAAALEDKLLLGMRAWFRCMLVHGFFHGDVHAGNLMALADGRVGFLDFGIVGRFNDVQRKLSLDFLMAITVRDFEGLARCMVAMGEAEGVDVRALGRDLEKAAGHLLDPSRPAKYADLLPVFTRVTLRHRMPMPADFVLILKQMLYFDRYAKLLAPNLNIFSDPRIVSGLMEDMMLAQAAAA